MPAVCRAGAVIGHWRLSAMLPLTKTQAAQLIAVLGLVRLVIFAAPAVAPVVLIAAIYAVRQCRGSDEPTKIS